MPAPTNFLTRWSVVTKTKKGDAQGPCVEGAPLQTWFSASYMDDDNTVSCALVWPQRQLHRQRSCLSCGKNQMYVGYVPRPHLCPGVPTM